MSKRKMLFAVLVLLILFVGWIAWDTSPAMEKHNIPKAENLELRILYPEKPSAKVFRAKKAEFEARTLRRELEEGRKLRRD